VTLRRLLRNWQLKVLAVFIALTTWSVVAYAGNPPNAQPFRGVTIERGQAPKGLVLVKELATVTVTVRGLQSSLANFRRESIHVSIDMSHAHAGTNLMPVGVHVDSPDGSVVFAGVEPSNIYAELDTLGTVQKKVDVRHPGTPNTCCVVGTGVAAPDSVTLSGPAKQLETAVAYVVVSVDGQGAPVSATSNVQVERGGDPNHVALTQVSAQPSQVSVTVPITAVKQQKPAGINPVTTGRIAPGFQIIDVQVNPAVCEISADPGVLGGIQTIDTEPISLAGANSDVVTTVKLRPPAGVTIVNNDTFIVHFVIRANPIVTVSPSPTP
jgi:YbbR domain-containing protein